MPSDKIFEQVAKTSVIVCPRSIQETPAIIDVVNRVSSEHVRDSGHSAPAIAWAPTLRQSGRAGAGPRRLGRLALASTDSAIPGGETLRTGRLKEASGRRFQG
jgi:hypothetical protein